MSAKETITIKGSIKLNDDSKGMVFVRAKSGNAFFVCESDIEDNRIVEVPEEVAEVIDEYRSSGHADFDIVMLRARASLLRTGVPKWITDNRNEWLHAVVDGYRIKKEKKWLVCVPHMGITQIYQRNKENQLIPMSRKVYANSLVGNPKSIRNCQFTEAQIKQYGLEDCMKSEVVDHV